jgi:GNAT superfamily N-acetyltransferase
VDVLNAWLQEHALDSDRSGMSRVYVTARDGFVVGYYGLANSVIEHADAMKKVARGMSRYPIPAVLITRLAVVLTEQRGGLGRHLVRDAMVRTVKAADEIGIRALHAHAKTPEARDFYLSLGFSPSPVDELHVQVALKTVKASLAVAAAPDL